MQLTPHFTLNEFTRSHQAERFGIVNRVPTELFHNVVRTAQVLEQVRAGLGNIPIVVSSGYRCPELNRKVGGSITSAHMQGLAVDFEAPSIGDALKVARAVRRLDIRFDQLIYEYEAWVHLGLAPENVEPRGEVLSKFYGIDHYLAGLVDKVTVVA